MCTYAEAMVLKGLERGIEQGLEQGRQAEEINTKREKARADAAEARIRELEAQLAAMSNS